MEDKLKDCETPEDMMEQFKFLDKEGSGEIGAHKFKHYMKTLGMRMDDDKLELMMALADGKGDGKVNIEAFCQTLCPPKPTK